MGGNVIASPRNPKVAAAARLRRGQARRKEGRTLLEGPHLLAEAVRAGHSPHTVFALEGDTDAATLAAGSDADLVRVTRPVLDRIAPTEHPRGPVAVLDVPEPEDVAGRNAVVLWGVGDPGNAGTVIRSAAAFGAAVIAGPDTVDLWAPKTLRAGAGAHIRCRIGRVAGFADLDVESRVATVVSGGRPLPAAEVVAPWAVLVGSEAHGLPAELVEAADVAVTIPMPGRVESLNAAAATAIVLYELAGRV